MDEILEYRGIEGVVIAEVTQDNDTGYVTGAVESLAGVAELSRTTDSSNEAHYYDNMPAVVVSSTAADEVTISASAIPFDVLAKITGQTYDSTKGAMIEGPRDVKYFALGYKTKKTNGDEVYVWRFKGTFNIPDSTHATENDGTDANGQEVVYTGIQTTHKFTANNNKGAKALNVDAGLNLADVSTFFDTVTTPDDLEAIASYDLTVTAAEGTTVTVTRSGTTVTPGTDVIRDGDVLTISVTGGTITVNGVAFTSGSTHTVTADVIVVSTAQA